MFDDIGSKIKGLAKVLCWVGIVVSVIMGIVVMCIENPIDYDSYLILPGLLIMVFGSLLSWVSSFFVYGFGQLIENSDILVSQGIKRQPEKSDSKNQNEKITTKTKPTIETVKSTMIEGLLNDEGKIICPICGFAQDSNRKCCWKCGAKFDKNDDVWQCDGCGKTNLSTNNTCWCCGKTHN